MARSSIGIGYQTLDLVRPRCASARFDSRTGCCMTKWRNW